STGDPRCAARVHLCGTLAHPVQGGGGPLRVPGPERWLVPCRAPGRVFPLHYRVLNAACPLRDPCGAPVSIRPRTRGVSGARPRRQGLVCLRVRPCRHRAVFVTPVGELRLLRLLVPQVAMSAVQAAPAGIEGAPAPVEPRTARKG